MLSTGQVVVGIQSIFWPSTAPKLLTRRMDFCFPLWLRKSSTWKCEWDCEHVLWRNLFPSWPFWTLPFFRRNKNRWHVGGVQYTFPNWHLQNRRWESIIFFFPEKRKLDEGRIQCVLKVACIFLWLSAFIPFPISKGWMFSSPGDRKCASLEWDGEVYPAWRQPTQLEALPPHSTTWELSPAFLYFPWIQASKQNNALFSLKREVIFNLRKVTLYHKLVTWENVPLPPSSSTEVTYSLQASPG